jgi:hypothetical protein
VRWLTSCNEQPQSLFTANDHANHATPTMLSDCAAYLLNFALQHRCLSRCLLGRLADSAWVHAIEHGDVCELLERHAHLSVLILMSGVDAVGHHPHDLPDRHVETALCHGHFLHLRLGGAHNLLGRHHGHPQALAAAAMEP